MTDFPLWLHHLAIVSIAIGIVSALVIAADLLARPQPMWIMNLVWPITALFGGFVWLAFYFLAGRAGAGRGTEPPMAIAVAKGTSHCGAGCTLGDLIVEWAAVAWPGLAVAFGWGSLFAEKTFAIWIPDYLVAFLLGIVFQYFTIAPMRKLGIGAGIAAAVKADALSITAWQIGMYGAMALGQFAWLRPRYGGLAEVASPEFWFLMQLSMLAGFAVSYPVNWWLIARGFKERM